MNTTAVESPPVPLCPRCSSARVVRNGPARDGTPTFRCRGCGRRFVAAPRAGPVGDDTKALVLRLLGERVSLRGVARVAGVSRTWLQGFVNALYRDDAGWAPGPLKKSPSRS